MDKKPYLRKILFIDAKLIFSQTKQVIVVSDLNLECIYEKVAKEQAAANKNCIFKIYEKKSDYWKHASLEYILTEEGLIDNVDKLSFYKIVKP